ncbi:MAG TPA: tryptophan 2,3-dioxygenase family protein [Actinocrinis sp.]|jgi:tryptophan 2,3-dioxygenase
MLTYGSYLQLDSLLDLQKPVGPEPVSAELLFITVHQVYELWFKLLLDALAAARDELLVGELAAARHPLARAHSLQRLFAEQIELLEKMTPREFAAFRGALERASGMQSVQYREVEILSGADGRKGLPNHMLTDDERLRLTRRMAEPSLWDGYLAALNASGLCTGTPADVARALQDVVSARGAGGRADVQAVTEDLRTYDALAAAWRLRHFQLAERHLGTQRGTGGTAGAEYLRKRIDRHFFPALWQSSDSSQYTETVVR